MPSSTAVLMAMALGTVAPAARAGFSQGGPAADEAAWIRGHVGVYAWQNPGEKGRLDYTRAERAQLARRLGTRIFRDHLWCCPEAWRPGFDPQRRTFVDYLGEEGWDEVLETFPVVIFTLGDGSGHVLEHDWTAERYRELTEYLLRRFADQPKTFILGMWEGDHWLKRPEEALPYFAGRHDGIVAGRAAVPDSQARVYEMIEVVTLDFEGRETLINHSVPQTQADLYSLSSWRYQDELLRALDYIKTHAPDSAAFGARNCMIGEVGATPEWLGEAVRAAGLRELLGQARQWATPFVTWWELAGREYGLLDGRLGTQRKRASYYTLYRAYHEQGDPLLIADFEADPLGPAVGESDAEGYPVNDLGGRWTVEGDGAFAGVRTGDARAPSGDGCLELRGGGPVTWRTDLMGVDARRYRALSLYAAGDVAAVTLALGDGQGQTAEWQAEEVVAGPAQGGWRELSVRLRDARRRLDIGDLRELAVTLVRGPGRLRLDRIALCGEAAREPAPAPTPGAPPRWTQVPLLSAHHALPVGAAPRSLALAVAPGASLVRPRLTDGTTEAVLAEVLHPGTELRLSEAGTSHVRFGPLSAWLDVAAPEKVGLRTTDLSAQPQFHALLPASRDEPCTVEWAFASPYPVTGFVVTVYGSLNRETAARLEVDCRGGEGEWAACPVATRNWDEEFWCADPPEGWQPATRISVRIRLVPDAANEQWAWTIGFSDLKIELTLDAKGLRMPDGRALTYEDDGPAPGLRGLLALHG